MKETVLLTVEETIPLTILLIDSDVKSSEMLTAALASSEKVTRVDVCSSITEAQSVIAEDEHNTIVIDPITLGLDEASEFIFTTRNKLPSLVFVLYVNQQVAERDRATFYRGERGRFSHFFKIDKGIPVVSFQEEVEAVLASCQHYLNWSMSEHRIARFKVKANDYLKSRKVSNKDPLVMELRNLIEKLQVKTPDPHAGVRPRTVFLSYRFAEQDYIDGLTQLLQQADFEIVTGMANNTYISKAIKEKIRTCEFFLCVMTRDSEKADGTYTTSPWLLEEKGVAIAYDKPLVLMVEDGVSTSGGLQGDWQLIHFAPKGFLKAALQAVRQLNSYTGKTDIV